MSNRCRSLKRQDRLTAKVAALAPISTDDPDVVIVRRAQDAEVVAVLRLLNPPDQEVLMLAAWEELTAPEIAGYYLEVPAGLTGKRKPKRPTPPGWEDFRRSIDEIT